LAVSEVAGDASKVVELQDVLSKSIDAKDSLSKQERGGMVAFGFRRGQGNWSSRGETVVESFEFVFMTVKFSGSTHKGWDGGPKFSWLTNTRVRTSAFSDWACLQSFLYHRYFGKSDGDFKTNLGRR
jgi:hypothetical protein